MLYTTYDSNLFELEENVLPPASGHRAKLIRAGELLEIEISPVWSTKPKGIPAKIVKPSRQAIKNQNEKNSRKMFAWLMEANFGKKDYHFVGTYRKAPTTEAQARRDEKNFIRRWQAARERAGLLPGKYMYVIEYSEIDGKQIHHHFVLEGGLDRDIVESLWDKGRTNCRRLQPDEFGLQGLAAYLAKDPRGKKRWGASRGLKRPKISYRKIKSKKRMERLATDENMAPSIFEKEFEGYRFLDMKAPKWSEHVSGVYVCARMRRIA